MSGSSPFIHLLSASFIEPSIHHPQVLPGLHELVPPRAHDTTPLSIWFQRHFPDGFSLPELLTQIEEDHSIDPQLYIQPIRAVLLPKTIPGTSFERVQLAKNVFSQLFNEEQVSTTVSTGFIKLNPWQIYVLNVALCHFHKLVVLLRVPLSNSGGRSAFLQSVFSFFCPQRSPPIRRLLPVSLVSGKLPISGYHGLTLKIVSPTSMEVISGDARAWPAVKFDERGFVAGKCITVADADTDNLVKLEFDTSLSRAAVRNAIWPVTSCRTREVDAVVDSFLAFKNVKTLTAGAAETFSTLIVSLDPTFILACYSCFDRDNFKSVFHALTTLFACKGRSLQLIKLLAYIDLSRVPEPNQIFRSNSNHFVSIQLYFDRIATAYRTEICSQITSLVIQAGGLSSAQCTEKDFELIADIFKLLLDRVSKVPPLVRAVCRYVRLITEILFEDSTLFYRPVAALFIFRFLVIKLSIPINGKVPDKAFIAFITQFAHLSTLSNAPIPGFERIAPIIARFFNELCKTGRRVPDIGVDRGEIINAAGIVKAFVCANAEKIRAFHPALDYRHVFVEEMIGEYIAANHESA
jgi:hypothetical protein